MRIRHWKLRPIPFFLCLGAVVLTACATTTGRDFNLISTEEEVALGKKFAGEVEQEEKVLDNADIQAYVRAIANRLAPAAPRHQELHYQVKVIDAPDTVNAFALPGGYLYVYTGLMKMCENEAELASVIAHEIGHVAAYHHGEMISRQVGFQMVAGMLLGQEPGAAAQVLATLVGTGYNAAYSREQERQADGLGMEIMARAGYSPDGMVAFMHKLLEEDQRTGQRPLPIFSSHPPTAERLQRLQSQAARYPLELRRNGRVNAAGYAQHVLGPLGGSGRPKQTRQGWEVIGKS